MKKILISVLVGLSLFFVAPIIVPSLQSNYIVQAASVKINKSKVTMNVKEKYTLKVKGTSKKVKWSTSNKKIATVSSKGKVAAKKKGKVTITAKVGSKKYKCKVKVENPKLNKTSLSLFIKEGYTLKLNGSSQTKKWSSSNSSVVSVSDGKITALKKGTATIKVKAGKTTYKCNVTVKTYENNLSISYIPLKYSVIAVITNNSNVALSASPTMVFYNASGAMQSTAHDFNYCIEPKSTVAMEFESYNTSTYQDQTFSNYKLSLGDVTKSFYNKNGASKIATSASKTDGSLIVEATNNSGYKLDTILISAIFYDAQGKAIGYSETYADCKENNSSDFINLYYPMDEKYDYIVPASYKIYVNHAYAYNN